MSDNCLCCGPWVDETGPIVKLLILPLLWSRSLSSFKIKVYWGFGFSVFWLLEVFSVTLVVLGATALAAKWFIMVGSLALFESRLVAVRLPIILINHPCP